MLTAESALIKNDLRYRQTFAEPIPKKTPMKNDRDKPIGC
jgi:hypothetical protein